jgi:hypothetical protein
VFVIPKIIVRADFQTNRRAATSSTEVNSGLVVCAREVVINFCPKISTATGGERRSNNYNYPAREARSPPVAALIQ